MDEIETADASVSGLASEDHVPPAGTARDARVSTLADIIEVGEKVERDKEVRIQFLSRKGKEIVRDKKRFFQWDRPGEPRPCHNCEQIGHWIRECKALQKMRRDRSNERQKENLSDKRELLRKLKLMTGEECDTLPEKFQ